ncbi:HAMP domain-containing protein [Kribbella sandramycini]|uniref:histidine kinase n=1 Tax=Kribbella sandramycini TaxID=60450 RepID=A0A7Y4L7J3_9ACTN|nr:ATP-binding protein [Kribbella sandramycini]MBB6570264.1 two-component system sensor histidine kinase BaeS [Kribbella sandramycini]NOL45818.1 HAMP domain-containing protein [Kribbella sandramycini]
MAARRSVLVRLLAGAVLIALCSIAATAWLAARSTTVAIQEQQGQALADDARIYQTLIEYAATHKSWAGIEPVLTRLEIELDRQITLTERDRTPIAGKPVPRDRDGSALIDPLRVSRDLTKVNTGGELIDTRVVGPFALTAAQRTKYNGIAKRVLTCVQTRSAQGKIVVDAYGRPAIEGAPPGTIEGCDGDELRVVEPPQLAAYERLQKAVNTCLNARGPVMPIKLQADLSWGIVRGPTAQESRAVPPPPDPDAVDTCLLDARRVILKPYVAPLALLFVSTQNEAAAAEFDLSPANQKRIAGVAAAILGVTVLIAVVGGVRLVQPLRALTKASRQMTGGDENIRVRVRGRDEIGQLSLAFNELADRRAKTESLRRAMVSDIAHELRTPLSNIRGWLEAVEDGVAQPDAAFIASLSEEAALLQHIIDDLRDLATADAGTLRIHPERVYLGLLLDQVVATYRAQAEHAGITLSAATIGDLELDADPVRLRQAIGNLVANALRFTPAGGAVRLEGRPDADHIVIDVIDTGAGIAPADLPKVFDRFWRADQSRNRHTGGSGLGLPIVRSLIEAHHGTATVTSTPDQGSTFTLRLPGLPDQAARPAVRAKE